MYSTTTDDGSDLRSAGAVAMALVMVVSMLAIGGVAAGSAAAQPTADNYDPPTYPAIPDIGDLDSDQFLVNSSFEDGEIDDNDQVFNELGGAIDDADSGFEIFIEPGEGYEEDVVVDTQVDLIGEDAGADQTDGVVLEGEDGTSAPALEIQADLVDVTGMTIVGDGGPAVQLTAQSSTDNVKDLDFLNNIVAADDGQVGFDAEPMSMGEPFDQNVLFQNEFTVTDGSTADTLVFIGGGVVTGEEQPDSYLIEDNEFRTQNAPVGIDDGFATTSLHLEADDSEVLENDFPAEGAEEAPYEIIVAGDGNDVLSNDLDSDGFVEGILLAAGDDFLAQNNEVLDADANGIAVGGFDAIIEHEDVTIDNNVVEGSGQWGVNAQNVDDLDVTNNDLNSNFGGVIVDDSSAVDITNNDILNNTVEGVSVTDSDVVTVGSNLITGGSTIDISGSSDVVVEFNTLVDTGGIILTDITGVTDVNNNEVTDGSGGISLEDVSDGATVTENEVDDNSADGVTATDIVGDLDVAENIVTDNDGDGVTVLNVTEGDTTIAENLVEDNDQTTPPASNHGISVSEVADLFIDDNEVTNNDDDGILVDGAGMVEVTVNDVDSHDESGINVTDTDSTHVMSNDVTDAGDGITVSDAADDARIEMNHVEDVGTGITLDAPDVAASAAIELNRLDDYNVGIAFDSFNLEQPPYAVYNALLDGEADADVSNAEEVAVEAILNFYGTGDSPADLHDISDLADFDGDVVYDPFLTANPVEDAPDGVEASNDVDVAGPDNTQDFAHELTLVGDGDGTSTDALVIAFPAPVDGTVGEVFDDVDGAQVFAYDATDDDFVPAADISDEHVDALDAFIVTGLEEGEDATVAFEYDDNLGPVTKDLEEGWNLVGAPQKKELNDAFTTISSEDSQVNHFLRDADDMPRFVDDTTATFDGEDLWFESTDDASGEPAPFSIAGNALDDADQIVSPYTGYWILVDGDDTGDAQIGSSVPGDTSAGSEVSLLNIHET